MLSVTPYRPLVAALLIATFLLLSSSAAPALAAANCVQHINVCPERGCAQAGTPDALLNERKRTRPPSSSAIEINLDDFEALQTQADHLFGHKKQLTAQD